MNANARILLLLMSLVPGLCPADGVQNVTVTELTIYMGSTVSGALVKFTPPKPNLQGCSQVAGEYVFIDFAAQVVPSGRDVYTSVLAAYLAGRKLGIGTSACNPAGWPIVYGININP